MYQELCQILCWAWGYIGGQDKDLNLMEFVMERMDNFDKCHVGKQVLLDRGGEQKNGEKTYLISGEFLFPYLYNRERSAS